jgi:Holliday junction resolvase RusA-like endonuclease
VYKSQQAETDEADFFALAMAHPDRPKTPLTGPVEVTIYAFLPQPKSVKSDFHVVKPDLDNLMKFALDCLTRARYWADDKQISVLYGLKLYGTPEWRIHIWYYPDKEGK